MTATLFWQVTIILFILCVMILPCIFALLSPKDHGLSKFYWFLISLVGSWPGYYTYYVTFIKNRREQRELRDI